MTKGKPKPKGRASPPKSGCGGLFGCLLSLVLFPILIPLVVLLWCASVLTGGIVKAAFSPPKGGD